MFNYLFNGFEISHLCSPKLHLLDQNIVKILQFKRTVVYLNIF